MRDLKLLFCSAEAFPIAKVGGLGDVAYSLPKALRAIGVDARLLIPRHKNLGKKKAEFEIKLGAREINAELYESEIDGIPIYLLGDEEGKIFGEGKKVYGEEDLDRYLFFSKAISEISTEFEEFLPDVVHLNDWHTAMASAFIYKKGGPKTIFTIHNLQYQGEFPLEYFEKIGFKDENIVHNGMINAMKAAILYSDGITTVSPTYAKEILTEEYGFGLNEILKENSWKLRGILNGIDYEVWNPEKDPYLHTNYGISDLEKKKENKEALCKEEGISSKGPLIGIVSRLTEQKGIDLLLKAIRPIIAEGKASFIALGTGERSLEEGILELEEEFPDRVKGEIKYSEELAHKIYGSADIFVAPSRFEPCGLTQMISMRYGTVPVVRNTGGLADTVISPEESEENARGFKFKRKDPEELRRILSLAIKVYEEKRGYWRKMQENGMKADFTWNKSAKEYLNFYLSLIE